MVRTWVSGGQNTEVVDKLKREIVALEAERDKLVDSNKAKVYQWVSQTIRAGSIPDGNLTKEVNEIISEYRVHHPDAFRQGSVIVGKDG